MFLKHTKWAMLWALLVLILCGIPGRDIPHISFLELLEFDKFVHAGIFFVLFSLTARGFLLQTSRPLLQRSYKLSAFILCITYGGALEVMQEMVFQGRSADIYDFIANSFGCMMGIAAYSWTEKQILVKLIK
jgi:glycopeptide antibiotics resistance protein